MPILTTLSMAGIYGLMAFMIVAAIGVVISRNLFHSALSLAVVLLGVAGIFLALHADFLAMVQILIYVGAVMTLVIFAIMLTERLGDKTIQQTNQQNLAAVTGLLIFFTLMIRVMIKTPWPIRQGSETTSVTTADLGEALLGTYVFPFEVISVILLAVLIGAIAIARKDKSS